MVLSDCARFRVNYDYTAFFLARLSAFFSAAVLAGFFLVSFLLSIPLLISYSQILIPSLYGIPFVDVLLIIMKH